MYLEKLQKKRFLMDIKVNYFSLKIRMLDVEKELWSLGDVSVRHGDDFDRLGGHSANQEAL